MNKENIIAILFLLFVILGAGALVTWLSEKINQMIEDQRSAQESYKKEMTTLCFFNDYGLLRVTEKFQLSNPNNCPTGKEAKQEISKYRQTYVKWCTTQTNLSWEDYQKCEQYRSELTK